jgi:hypothetical protein
MPRESTKQIADCQGVIVSQFENRSSQDYDAITANQVVLSEAPISYTILFEFVAAERYRIDLVAG